MKIAALLMVKNESRRIHVTLQTLSSFDALIVYDTGSTDNTIDIIRKFCDTWKIPFHLLEGDFVDFSTNRNELLEFADTVSERFDIDYYLLLDCNDELYNFEGLYHFCVDNQDIDQTGFLIRQEWYVGKEITSYYNIRLIKSRCGWQYHNPVHEFIANEKETSSPIQVPDGIYIYQDRTKDDDKTLHRFHNDAKILLKEYEKDPKNARTVFYLAQTYECLGNYTDAIEYYKKRCKLGGFYEEVFASHLRIGLLLIKISKNVVIDENTIGFVNPNVDLLWDNILTELRKAYMKINRVEPLIPIIQYYIDHKQWLIAFHYCQLAIETEYPKSILFVDKNAYEYERYHMMGIVAYYCGKYKEGMSACQIAIEKRNQPIDHSNLKFYVDKLVE